MVAELPWVTEAGVFSPVTARSVTGGGGGFTVTTVEPWLFAALASVRLSVATRVCPPSAAFEIGRASGRERASTSVVAGSLKKTSTTPDAGSDGQTSSRRP